MKLADIKSGKPVAICDQCALFCFTNPASAKIPRLKKSAFTAMKKGGAK